MAAITGVAALFFDQYHAHHSGSYEILQYAGQLLLAAPCSLGAPVPTSIATSAATVMTPTPGAVKVPVVDQA
jgi:hypothetical protein